MKSGFVYILTNQTNDVLYTGVTSDLKKRIYQHKNKLLDGFTKKYNLSKLVFYEAHDSIYDAITREKQIKSGSRAKKMALIKSQNPSFRDLYDDL